MARALGLRSARRRDRVRRAVGRYGDGLALWQLHPTDFRGAAGRLRPVPLVRQPVEIDQDRTPRSVMAPDKPGLLEGVHHLLDARPVGTQDAAQVRRSQPVPGSPPRLGAVGDVAPAADRQQGHPAAWSRDVLRPRRVPVSPVLRGVRRLLLPEPSFGRLLGDEVAVEESHIHQRPVRPGNGIPAHAHGPGDLPAGRRLLLVLVLAAPEGVDDQLGERQAAPVSRMEYPRSSLVPQLIRSRRYYIIMSRQRSFPPSEAPTAEGCFFLGASCQLYPIADRHPASSLMYSRYQVSMPRASSSVQVFALPPRPHGAARDTTRANPVFHLVVLKPEPTGEARQRDVGFCLGHGCFPPK